MTTLGSTKKGETLACLIIDDPLLIPQYGCLDYNKLLKQMKAHNFFTEIAFIPWNYERSDPNTVRLFVDNTDYYAICVHGCNHIYNEFGGRAYQELSALSSTALWRMEQHKRLTGLSYDPVIVFPQGRFSSVAMQALKAQGYLAAFNSTLLATDRKELPYIEYQRPATTVYYDFPLFLRRYPKDKTGLLHDMKSGRPIILVEHHSAFRDGYKEITDCVDWLNGLGNIKWKSLSYIAEYYLGEKSVAVEQQIPQTLQSVPYFNTKVALRRFLSEFRDHYIEPSGSLSRLYMMLRNLYRHY